MSSGCIMPLDIDVGVHSTRFWPRRTEMFPSVAATYPRSCSSLPIRHTSCRMHVSFSRPISCLRAFVCGGEMASLAGLLYVPLTTIYLHFVPILDLNFPLPPHS